MSNETIIRRYTFSKQDYVIELPTHYAKYGLMYFHRWTRDSEGNVWLLI